jgi:hypothetical protein
MEEVFKLLEKKVPKEIAEKIIDIKEEMELEDMGLVTCERCGNVWDGNAQCFPCNYFDDDD